MTIDEFFSIRFRHSRQSGFSRQQNSSIEIDKNRFMLVLSKKGIPAPVIDVLFRTIDSNGDGKISRNDFLQVLHKYTPKARTREAAESDTMSKGYQETAQRSEPLEKSFTYRKSGVHRSSSLGIAVDAMI